MKRSKPMTPQGAKMPRMNVDIEAMKICEMLIELNEAKKPVVIDNYNGLRITADISGKAEETWVCIVYRDLSSIRQIPYLTGLAYCVASYVLSEYHDKDDAYVALDCVVAHHDELHDWPNYDDIQSLELDMGDWLVRARVLDYCS